MFLMSDDKPEKLVIILTHGMEDPDRASMPFVMANAALAMDVKVTVILQGTAVFLCKKGTYECVLAPGLPPLKELMNSFIEQDGTLLVCHPCLNERHITKEMILDQAHLIKSARAVTEALEATNVITY
jgi:predicted peroxiredoxin